jgi:hypothetical protein
VRRFGPAQVGSEERRLLRLFGGLDAAARRSLLDYAEFLAGRAGPAPAVAAPAPVPRPAVETVTQAIKRLNRSYPGLQRHRLMPRVEQLLARHMVDGRPAPEVIDELEALFAAELRLAGGD